MFSRSPAALPAHAPRAHGASRATDLCISLAIDSASNFVGAAYAIPTPWLHQDTTTIALYGAYADDPKMVGAPRPAYGHSKDGRDDLKQVLLSLGVSGDGGLPLRLGVRDGNRSDSVETPVALEECLALGLEGMRGIVADSKAYSRRTLGLCLEHGIGLVTLVP